MHHGEKLKSTLIVFFSLPPLCTQDLMFTVVFLSVADFSSVQWFSLEFELQLLVIFSSTNFVPLGKYVNMPLNTLQSKLLGKFSFHHSFDTFNSSSKGSKEVPQYKRTFIMFYSMQSGLHPVDFTQLSLDNSCTALSYNSTLISFVGRSISHTVRHSKVIFAPFMLSIKGFTQRVLISE